MCTTQIRERFHSLIDHIDDENRLKNLYDALADADVTPREIIDKLTPEQRQRLEISLEQAHNGDVMSHQEVKQEIDEWSSK